MRPYHRSLMSGAQRGFTLLELMFAITLIGVLLMVGLPSYQSYINKGKSRLAAQQISAMGAVISAYWTDARAYPATLADVGMTGRLDPWGNAYVYYNVEDNGKGGARKDHALNPINTDFDLYSMGPDGQTKKQISQKDSVDDIIRASNGAFTGIAADF